MKIQVAVCPFDADPIRPRETMIYTRKYAWKNIKVVSSHVNYTKAATLAFLDAAQLFFGTYRPETDVWHDGTQKFYLG